MASSSLNQAKSSTQGPFVIWHGMRLRELRRLLHGRPPMDWTRWKQIFLLPSFATYNSVMNGVENLLFGGKFSNIQLDEHPIFILGFWRSGTTLLHNLITRDPRFTYPNTYQCLFPWHFLTTERFATPLTGWLMPKTRPMDNVETSWNAPQEDDIALCIMSLVSPYIMLANQREKSTYISCLELNGRDPAEKKSWMAALDLFIRKLTVRNNKPVVLKSPSHTYRVRTLLEMYPNAKFLYIYRNPYSVFRSTVHLRETMIRENGLAAPRPMDHGHEVIDMYNLACRTYETDKHLIPAGNLHEIRFEELEVDPLGELENCYRGLGLEDFDTVRAIIEPDVPKLRRYRKNRFEHDPVWMRAVYDQCRESFDRYGYPSPLEELDSVAA